MKLNVHVSLLCIALSITSIIYCSEAQNNLMKRSASDSSIELSHIESLKKHKNLLGIVSLHRDSPDRNIRENYYKIYSFSSGDNSSLGRSRSREWRFEAESIDCDNN